MPTTPRPTGPLTATATTASACEPYRELHRASAQPEAATPWRSGRTWSTAHGFAGRYQSVKRFVRKLRGAPSRKPCAVIVTAPGEEAQVDYGDGPMVRDPHTGKYRRTRLFVLTLGYSRKCVRLLIFQFQLADLGRAARTAVSPAGRRAARRGARQSARRRARRPTSTIPLSTRSTATCWRTTAQSRCPAASQIPIAKARSSRGVGHAQKTPLKGLRFETLAEAQAYLDHWEERWADTRIHGTTKRQVAAMFAEEKPALLPLPLEPFRYYQYGERTVHLDGCVEVEAAYYSAPPGWIGRRSRCSGTPRTSACSIPDRPTAARAPAPGSAAVIASKTRTAHRKRRSRIAATAGAGRQAGAHIGALCANHARAARTESPCAAFRAFCALGQEVRRGRVDDACAAALEVGRVRLPLRAPLSGAERATAAELRQVDPLIRQLTLYRDLIDSNEPVPRRTHE